MTEEKHVPGVVLDNATVQVGVMGVVNYSLVALAQPNTVRTVLGVFVDGVPWLVSMTVAQESPLENTSSTS